jgi:hypothetical protein
MHCDECGIALYEAGDVAPAGVYTRVDDESFRRVTLERTGPLPASFDGHVAEYRAAAATCVCERRHAPTAVHAAARDAARNDALTAPIAPITTGAPVTPVAPIARGEG